MSKGFESLVDLKFFTFVRGFRAESAGLWFLCLYIFFEYIRPQGMYPVIDILPWGLVTLILLLISTVLTRSRSIGFGPMEKMFVAMTLVVIFSAVFAWNPDASLKIWVTFTSWVIMYYCLISILTTPARIYLFVIFFILINFKLSQHGARTFAMRGFSFTHWGLSGSPGWFHNSGEFSLQMVVLFSISLSLLRSLKSQITSRFRWWVLLILFPGTAFLSVIGSSSRGGQIALAAVLFFFLFKWKHFFRVALVVSLLIFLTPYLIPEEQMARFETMGGDPTSQYRLMHWENAYETIKQNPMGIGYNNWFSYYKSHFDAPVYQVIHNTILQAFVELGYIGGILFLIMLITAFLMNARTVREMLVINELETVTIASIAQGINLGLLGTLVASIFMSVLYYPMFWLAFALTSALKHISNKKIEDLKNLNNNSINSNGYCKDI